MTYDLRDTPEGVELVELRPVVVARFPSREEFARVCEWAAMSRQASPEPETQAPEQEPPVGDPAEPEVREAAEPGPEEDLADNTAMTNALDAIEGQIAKGRAWSLRGVSREYGVEQGELERAARSVGLSAGKRP